MTESKNSKLDMAIQWLKDNYELAIKNEHIKYKVEWALYLTWQQAEQARSNEEARSHNKTTPRNEEPSTRTHRASARRNVSA